MVTTSVLECFMMLMDNAIIFLFVIMYQVELQYLHDYAGISSSIGLSANPIVNFSGVIGSNVLALGTDLSFDTKTGNFTKCNAGLSFSNADLIASLSLYVMCSMHLSVGELFEYMSLV